MATHQAPPSLGFSRQEHWSGLPFPSLMHESEKWKWSRSVMSNPQRPHGLQPTRLLRPWDFPGESTGMGCHSLCNPMDCGPPGFFVLGILEARILEWVAISYVTSNLYFEIFSLIIIFSVLFCSYFSFLLQGFLLSAFGSSLLMSLCLRSLYLFKFFLNLKISFYFS